MPKLKTPRNDSSFGLYLKGDGKGNFSAETMMDSGLKIVGDVRDLELIIKNGKVHILAAKNGRPTTTN